MKGKEKIKVFIKYENGKTACICHRSNKKCNSKTCEAETVERDKFEGWKSTMFRDCYGR